MNNKYLCDLCNSPKLSEIYAPLGTRRGLKIYICESCELVQSFPKIDHVPIKNVRVSGGADWGNIRYGKAFRTAHDIELFKKYGLNDYDTCLDIGSSRGSFVEALLENKPNAVIWGVEPDDRIIKYFDDNSNIKIINDRIENIDLPDDYFDFIYLSHTLEHIKSPNLLFKKIYRSLKIDGEVYIDVPNIEFLSTCNIIEEWFIDKHLYHFSKKTLIQYSELHGFDIKYISDNNDIENLSVILKKKGNLSELVQNKTSKSFGNNSSIKNLIKNYSNALKNNHKDLKSLGSYLNKLSRKNKVVIWGLGRIFDCLIDIGGLDPNKLHGVIDKFLSSFVKDRYGQEIKSPDDLSALDPDIIFIASRAYHKDIKKEILSIDKNFKTISYDEAMVS